MVRDILIEHARATAPVVLAPLLIAAPLWLFLSAFSGAWDVFTPLWLGFGATIGGLVLVAGTIEAAKDLRRQFVARSRRAAMLHREFT
jgi:hypothetical protein